MRTSRFLLVPLVLGVALSAHAQHTSAGIRYRWHDNKGLPHYSDSLTDDAIKYGYDMVNDRGMVVGHVQRQLSPEERLAAQKLAAEQATAQRIADERRRADLQLLNTYGDEASLQRAQQEELANIDQQIQTTRINLRSQEKALADLLDRAAELERAKQPVPRSLADSIGSQRNIVAEQRNTMQRQQARRAQAEQQATATLDHFRALKQAQKEAQG